MGIMITVLKYTLAALAYLLVPFYVCKGMRKLFNKTDEEIKRQTEERE